MGNKVIKAGKSSTFETHPRRDLISSMDCLLLWRPWQKNQLWKPKTEGLHIDQNPFHKYSFSVIWFYLLSNKEGSPVCPRDVATPSSQQTGLTSKIFLSESKNINNVWVYILYKGWRSWGSSQVSHGLCSGHCQVKSLLEMISSQKKMHQQNS